MTKWSQDKIDRGAAEHQERVALDNPVSYVTPMDVFQRLIDEYKSKGATEIKHTVVWDKSKEWTTLIHQAIGHPDNPGDGENDTRPCPPCAG